MMESHHHHDSLFFSRPDQTSKGEYGLASTLDDDDDDRPSKLTTMESLEIGGEDDDNGISPRALNSVWFVPLFPDNRLDICGVQLMDSVHGVRLFKFFVVTWIGLLGMFYFVRFMVSSPSPRMLLQR